MLGIQGKVRNVGIQVDMDNNRPVDHRTERGSCKGKAISYRVPRVVMA